MAGYQRRRFDSWDKSWLCAHSLVITCNSTPSDSPEVLVECCMSDGVGDCFHILDSCMYGFDFVMFEGRYLLYLILLEGGLGWCLSWQESTLIVCRSFD